MYVVSFTLLRKCESEFINQILNYNTLNIKYLDDNNKEEKIDTSSNDSNDSENSFSSVVSIKKYKRLVFNFIFNKCIFILKYYYSLLVINLIIDDSNKILNLINKFLILRIKVIF